MANAKALVLAKQLEQDIMGYVDCCMAAARLLGGQDPVKLERATLACYTFAAKLADSYPNPSVSRIAWDSLASYWFGQWENLERAAEGRKAVTTAAAAASNPHDSAPRPAPSSPQTAAPRPATGATSVHRPRGSGTPAGPHPTP